MLRRTPAPSTTAAMGPSEPARVPVMSNASGAGPPPAPGVGISMPKLRRSMPGTDKDPGRSMRCLTPAWNVKPLAVSSPTVTVTEASPAPPANRACTNPSATSPTARPVLSVSPRAGVP